jgi:hypothetical protein
MKVYSLYYNDEFIGAFSSKEHAISYAQYSYTDEQAWYCNVIEEYLFKHPPQPPSSPFINTEPTKFPKPYFDTYGGVKAE